MYRNIAADFEAIDLKGMDRVSLMERTDRKFVVKTNTIWEILQEVSHDYYMLEINNERMLQYSTYYYDTNDDQLYLSHHNGRLNRYKVRKRTYVETDTSFLEVKFKSNKGKTIKTRIRTNGNEMLFTDEEKAFLSHTIPYNPDTLKPKSFNGFKRITLTDKALTERCTIDFSFQFRSFDETIKEDDLAIIELKQDCNSKSSKLYTCLQNRRIKPGGFSKYCMGRILTEEGLKKNSFKPKMRELYKIIHN